MRLKNIMNLCYFGPHRIRNLSYIWVLAIWDLIVSNK